MKTGILAGIFALTSIIHAGCAPESICSRLQTPACEDPPQQLCGCFEMVEITGGFTGEKSSARSQDIVEEIVLRPDSAIEYYRRDTLLWRTRLTLMPPLETRGKKVIRLDIVGRRESGVNTVEIEDGNHLWLYHRHMADASGLKFERR